jgi:hypothetical protein
LNGARYTIDSSSPYSLVWDTTNLSGTQQQLFAKIDDVYGNSAGNVGVSNSVSVARNSNLFESTPSGLADLGSASPLFSG